MTSCDEETGCITCGDVAVEMTVLRVDELRRLALCAAAGGEKETVETELVGAVAPGDALLVHAGTALQRLAIARPDAESLVSTAGLDASRRLT